MLKIPPAGWKPTALPLKLRPHEMDLAGIIGIPPSALPMPCAATCATPERVSEKSGQPKMDLARRIELR